MTVPEELTAALEGRSIERIAIDITNEGFVWTLFADGQAIFAGEAGPDQVAGMLQATEVLINTELGIDGAQLCRPAFN